MPDNPLTSEFEPAAPPTPVPGAADEVATQDVAPPEPEPSPVPSEAPAAPAETPPAPEPVVAEAAAPPEPPNPVPLTPTAEVKDEPVAEVEASAEPAGSEPEPSTKRWYVVKVQSGREETIKEAIERRVKIERLEESFGQIVIPVERVTEMRKGKRVVKERKLYPGYLMAEVELVDADGNLNDRILYLFRETSGVGDFVGMTMPKIRDERPRPPPPMSQREIDKILGTKPGPEEKGKVIEAKPPVDRGDRVKVRDGTFAGMEGEVKEILETLNHLRVELTIFGRPVPVELEYWQVEPV